MRSRLARYLEFLQKDRRAVMRMLALTVFGLGAYAVTLLGFFSGYSDRGDYAHIFDRAATGGVANITLKSIDHSKQRIAFDFAMIFPEGRGTVTKCLQFGYNFRPRSGTPNTYGYSVVSAVEIPRDSLQPQSQPGPGFTTYQDTGDFHFDTDLRLFPFDHVQWDVAVFEQCTDSAMVGRPKFSSLTVHSDIPDYLLSVHTVTYQNHSNESFMLRRSMFLRILTLIVFATAFASSVVLIWQANRTGGAIPLLTYFAGLWGIRQILLSPIQDLKALPTLLEITILFLFGFTLLGVVLAPRIFPFAKEK